MSYTRSGAYHITGRQSGRTYVIRRDGVARALGWSVCAPGGAWYSQFVSLPHARKWALEH